MNTIEKITLDMLTETSVSILRQKFIEVDGQQVQVGQDHRKVYVNSELSRSEMMNELPEQYVNTVFSLWGDIPTVQE